MLEKKVAEVIQRTDKYLEKKKKEEGYQPKKKENIDDELQYFVTGCIDGDDDLLPILSDVKSLPLQKLDVSDFRPLENHLTIENFLYDIAEKAIFEKAKETVEYDKYLN